MKQSDDNKPIPMTSLSGGKKEKVTKDVFYYTNQIVNVVFVGTPEKNDWFLIDTGMPKSAKSIFSAAESLYGQGSKPTAIILTHGHFDHVGGITELIEKWQVPVYAHPLEFPYLTNKKAYPEPDSSVEGGMLAKISSIYPHEPIDISEVLNPLPADQTLPGLPKWRWIHTPGHTPGHISLFRNDDKTLIAGDAFVTVKQDSFYKVLTQKKEVHGPPRYLTTDWQAAENSVRELTNLGPQLAVTGHGEHMEGEDLMQGLKNLVENFQELAVPDHGKFIDPGDKK